jgi:hypothetical protein
MTHYLLPLQVPFTLWPRRGIFSETGLLVYLILGNPHSADRMALDPTGSTTEEVLVADTGDSTG